MEEVREETEGGAATCRRETPIQGASIVSPRAFSAWGSAR